MRLHFAVALLSAIVALSDPPAPHKGRHLPPPPVPEVVPTPMPSPDAPTVLPAGVEFVIDSDKAQVVNVIPPGSMKVVERFVPAGSTLVLPGKFLDDATGTKVIETDREFIGPCYVYRLSAAKGKGAWVVVAENGTDKPDVLLRRISFLDAPPDPKPVDPTPDPKPVDPPAPAPVTSFRVIFVYESGDSLTPDQRSVVYGKVVEDYLNANCTGGKAGWRRRDKDAPGETDPAMKALWDAVKPKVTTTPCVAVEVNGKVEIIPPGATPAAMTGILDKYRGVK